MVTPTETGVVAALSLAGALAEAAVAVRWYDPPSRNGETPAPYLEAGVFCVGFAVVFGLLGLALTVVAGLARPYTALATLLLTPVGAWLAFVASRGRVETVTEPVERYSAAVAGSVAALYPLALLAA